jgi:2-polyprenyl-3-methyl-5-hydroxy-6-metoxy-1,4-benzoquinol methylase
MIISNPALSDYLYRNAEAEHTCAYLWEPVIGLCDEFGAKRVLDLGCGNGTFARELIDAGFEVVGCDPSANGVDYATQLVPSARFIKAGVYDDPALVGDTPFDVIISMEVVEHLFFPARLPRFAARLLRPGGHLIVTTPYHGYLKNLILSLTNKWDHHFDPFWDGGHVKFWSRRTLTTLIEEEGFTVDRFVGVGRCPYVWKSMILTATPKPAD